jgi:hypothetical protein
LHRELDDLFCIGLWRPGGRGDVARVRSPVAAGGFLFLSGVFFTANMPRV